MTDEQKAAYVSAQAVAANIEALAMLAANRDREAQALSPAYGEEAFIRLIDDYDLHHNSIIGLFHDR